MVNSARNAAPGSYHPRSVIVGFNTPVTRMVAHQHLHSSRGFIEIRHVFTLTSAVVVEVDQSQVVEFIDDASKDPSVIYCHPNWLVSPAAVNTVYSYPESVNKHYQDGWWSLDNVRSIHNITSARFNAGRMLRIAIIDSGMSPHPLLPSTSSGELQLRGTSSLNATVAAIETRLDPFDSRSPSTVADSFSLEVDQSINEYCKDQWKRWATKADRWFLKQSLPPVQPNTRTLFGPDRISPFSRNFVVNSSNVMDNDGHGTQMAGIIAGKGPHSDLFPELIGLVPDCELLILKCYDNNHVYDSNTFAILKALDYCSNQGVDIIFIGLALNANAISVGNVAALSGSIAALRTKNISVVSPAGNDNRIGLALPAAIPESISITAVAVDAANGLSIAPYSNEGDPSKNESAVFCAYGGDVGSLVITTDLHMGYCGVAGTSVAAAIATGILATRLSDMYTNDVATTYSKFLDSFGTSQQRPSSFLPSAVGTSHVWRDPLTHFTNSATVSSLISRVKLDADQTILRGQHVPSERYGFGLLRL